MIVVLRCYAYHDCHCYSQCHQITLIHHASNSRNSPSITNSRASLFELLLHQQKNTKPSQQTIPKRRPFLKPKDSPSTFPRSQVRSRSLASIDWRITRSCRISFSTTLKSSSYLAWSKSFLPDWKLEVGTLLFWEVEIWTGSSWSFKMPPQNTYDVKTISKHQQVPVPFLP